MYLDDRTPDSLRETIVRDPSLACGFVGQNTREKIAVETDDAAKFEGMLRLLLKLAADIEPFFFNPGQAYMSRYSVLISAAVSSMEGLLSLVKTVSPGKPVKGKGGADGKVDNDLYGRMEDVFGEKRGASRGRWAYQENSQGIAVRRLGRAKSEVEVTNWPSKTIAGFCGECGCTEKQNLNGRSSGKCF